MCQAFPKAVTRAAAAAWGVTGGQATILLEQWENMLAERRELQDEENARINQQREKIIRGEVL